MRPIVLALVFSFALFAGCTEADTDGARYRLHGDFTPGATQEDIADLRMRAERQGGEAQIMESDPPAFQVRGLEADACGSLRGELEGSDYVASVSDCLPEGQ